MQKKKILASRSIKKKYQLQNTSRKTFLEKKLIKINSKKNK